MVYLKKVLCKTDICVGHLCYLNDCTYVCLNYNYVIKYY